jgi:hypothetical protein
MATSENKILVLDYYFGHRHLDWARPTEQDFAGKLTAAEVLEISSQLADQGFISWSAEGGEYGSGQLTFKGTITCVEPRFAAPELPVDLPKVPVPSPAPHPIAEIPPPEPVPVAVAQVSAPEPALEGVSSEKTSNQPAPTEAGSFYDRGALFFPRRISHKQTTKQTKQKHGTIHQTTRSTRARQTSRSRREDSRRFVPAGHR